MDEVVWRKRRAPQARRPHLQDDIRVIPDAAGVDEGSTSRFIVVRWKLGGKASAMFDQDCLEALLEEESGVLGSDCDSLLASANCFDRVSELATKQAS